MAVHTQLGLDPLPPHARYVQHAVPRETATQRPAISKEFALSLMSCLHVACEAFIYPSERFEPHLLVPWGGLPPRPPSLAPPASSPPKGEVERRGSPYRHAFWSCFTWAL